MTLSRKQYGSSDDYWKLRGFFRRLHAANPRPGSQWHIGQFDYWRWHWLENVVECTPEELRYWETGQGDVAGVLLQGDPGVCHLMVHPEEMSDALYHEMLETAEATFAVLARDGRRVIFAWSDQTDDALNEVLSDRGYALAEGGHATEYNAWLPLSAAPDDIQAPVGYTIRSMGGVEELQARNIASWRAFHPGEPDEGAGPTGDWYRNVQRAPLYRRDLDVIAVAGNSDIAAFSICYFDDVSRTGVFLLVGSAPPHDQKGLEEAVMTETLRRLHRLGAIGAYVSWYASDPGEIYESVGFADQQTGRVWKKVL